MSPDLNSLPPSTTDRMEEAPQLMASGRPERISLSNGDSTRHDSPSPLHSPTAILPATAAFAGHRRSLSNSQTTSRRRSNLMNNVSMNDGIPALDERQLSNGQPRSPRRSFNLPMDSSTASHGRQISLGELHQELENEQEAQVNRLLSMIRLQQEQLTALTRQQPGIANTSAIISEHVQEGEDAHLGMRNIALARPNPLTRNSSHRSSRGVSPALRPLSASLGSVGEDLLLGGSRDEASYYQAETQNLTRENQMLKNRIRELERQIADVPVLPDSTQFPVISSSNASSRSLQITSASKD